MSRKRIVHRISSLFAAISTAGILLVAFAGSAFAGQITDVSVKGLSDRDLVIIKADKEIGQPDMVVQKLLPTRLEAAFVGSTVGKIDTSELKSGLITKVQAIAMADRVLVVVQLDHQGKANPEMFRWSNPRSGICVLEVFHPTSDHSALQDSAFTGGGEPAVVVPNVVPTASVPVATVTAPAPEIAKPDAFVNAGVG